MNDYNTKNCWIISLQSHDSGQSKCPDSEKVIPRFRVLSFRAVPGFGQKYEYEEEAEDADGAVEEEGCGGGGKLVDVFERLGHHEPPQVGRGVRHRVRPPLGPAQALVRSICVPRESQCKITAELHFLLA